MDSVKTVPLFTVYVPATTPHHEVRGDVHAHVDRRAVQDGRRELPLPHRIGRGAIEIRMRRRQHAHLAHRSVACRSSASIVTVPPIARRSSGARDRPASRRQSCSAGGCCRRARRVAAPAQRSVARCCRSSSVLAQRLPASARDSGSGGSGAVAAGPPTMRDRLLQRSELQLEWRARDRGRRS